MRDQSPESTARFSNEPVSFARALIFTFVSVAIYAYLVVAIPSFRDLFQGFGAELPAPTRWLLQYYDAATILLVGSGVLLGLLIYSKIRGNDPLLQNLSRASTWCFMISVAFVFFALIAIYLPVFKMGSVI